jgi:uncharacterized protein YybS (DUF2232 family)
MAFIIWRAGMFSGVTAREWIWCSIMSFMLFVAGMLVPFASLPLMLIYPFPIILLTFRSGPSQGFLSCFSVAAAIFFLFSPIFSVFYFFTFGFSGVLMGITAKRTKGAEMLFMGIVCSLSCKLLTALLLSHFSGFNFFAPDTAEIERTLIAFSESGLGALSDGSMLKLKENISDKINDMVMLIPFSIMFFTSVETLLSYCLSSYMHKRRSGEKFFSLPPFGRWSFPRNILVPLLIGFACEIAGDKFPDIYILRQADVNLSAVSRTLLVIQGLAVAYCFMEFRDFPKAVRIIMIIATPFITILGDIFSFLGIVDMGFDLRKQTRGKSR